MLLRLSTSRELLHPNAPQGTQGTLETDGSISVSWNPVEGAKSYIIHYSPANETDPSKAIYMGYSETTDFTLAKADIPVPHASGDKFYFYVQTYNVVGKGATGVEKARYLHDGQFTGSAWSTPAVEVTVTTASTLAAPAALEKPTDSNTVAEIKAYLDAQGISYSSSATKTELLALV